MYLSRQTMYIIYVQIEYKSKVTHETHFANGCTRHFIVLFYSFCNIFQYIKWKHASLLDSDRQDYLMINNNGKRYKTKRCRYYEDAKNTNTNIMYKSKEEAQSTTTTIDEPAKTPCNTSTIWYKLDVLFWFKRKKQREKEHARN